MTCNTASAVIGVVTAFLARFFHRPKRTMIRPWPYLRVQATRVGALLVHGAAAGLGIQKLAVATGAAGEGEDAVFEVEVVNQPGFAQAFGDLFGFFVFGFEGVYQP